MPSRPDLITASMLGHDIDANRKNWSRLAGMIPTAPRIMRGVQRPKISPANRKYLSRRYAGQLIGCCVGEGGAHQGEYLANRKDGMGKDGRGKSLSSLWVYQTGRALCARQGIRLGGEGCIVTVAADAVAATGFASLENYPVDDPAYNGYSDRNPLPAAAVAEGKSHRLVKYARCTSFDEGLDYLSQGFVLWVGKPIRSGMMSTRDDGYYQIKGGVVGGHSTLLVDYDLTAGPSGRIYEFNSWANALWGEKSDDPLLPPECQGHDNIGWTDLDAMSEVFNDSDLSDGTCEIVVGTLEETWTTPIASFAETLV